MNKCKVGIGFHTGTPSFANGIGDYWRALAENGHAVFAKGADNAGVCYEVQQLQKEYPDIDMYAVWRKTTFSHGSDIPIYIREPEEEAKRYWDEIDASWPQELDKEFVWVEFPNEVDKERSGWIGEFMYYSGEIALERGYKYLGPAWSGGEPEPEHWEFLEDYLFLCSDTPNRLGISLHEYTFSKSRNMVETVPFLMGRVSFLNEYCKEQSIPLPQVFMTEWGWGANDAPHYSDGIPQIIEMVEMYLQYTSNVKGVALWCLDSGWQWTELSKTMNAYIQPLAEHIIAHEWTQPQEPGIPPVVPEDRPKVVIFKRAQEHTEVEATIISEHAFSEYRRTVTASHDDMITMMRAGNGESYAVIFDPEYASQKEAINHLKAEGLQYEVRYLLETPKPTPPDFLVYRPCDTPRITQYFAARPEVYQKWGLPGHEGIDYGVPMGEPFYAAQKGEVVWVSDTVPSNGNKSNYGWHVYLKHFEHDTEFHTVYAHGAPNPPVSLGDIVEAGDVVLYSGNTGFSSGPHLHFGVLAPHDTKNGYPMWTFGQPINPLPYLDGKDAPVSQQTYDMLEYLRGDGRMYEVQHPGGTTETFQVQTEGDFFYLVKNAQWEQYKHDNSYIWRGRDTSPGQATNEMERPDHHRYYDQYETGNTLARWCKRHMHIGETFVGSGHQVQFRYKDDCAISIFNSGPATNVVRFVDYHEVFYGKNGIVVEDVVELKTSTGESMYFGRGYGLVGWESPWGQSLISEIHHGRDDLEMERIWCG